MEKTKPRLASTGLSILAAAFLIGSPLFAADYYSLGIEEHLLSDPGQYSTTDGDATAATTPPGAKDDLFFYNSNVTGPADRVLQAGDTAKPYNSMTFRGNAGKTQINRISKTKSSDSTIIYILNGGITVAPGAGPVIFGGSGQRVAIGARADFTIANNSSSDLTFNREIRGYTPNTTHTITVAGSGSGNTIFKDIWDNNHGRGLAMTIETTGSGVVRFDGKNTYKGPTAVKSGKLFVNSDSREVEGEVAVSAKATLGGRGGLGGNVTIADNGCLEFEISKPADKHKPMTLAPSRTLAFSGASQLTITSSGGAQAGTYKLISAPGGITGSAPTTLHLPDGWKANVSIAGSDLLLDLTSTGTH